MQFGKYTFNLKLQSNAHLPRYKGSTFRGVLGHALKKTVCALKQQECHNCILRSSCTYALVFETSHAIPQIDNARVSSPPHPLVLEPPLTEKTIFNKGEHLECSLILFGPINRNIAYFIYAFDQMGKIGLGRRIKGKRAEFTLESVLHNKKTVYKKQSGSITAPLNPDTLELQHNSIKNAASLKIKVKTPLRITGKPSGRPDLPFPLLIRSLIRRNTSLLNTYGQGEPELDYTDIVKKAYTIKASDNNLAWFDWKRYSAKQDRKMFMGGLVGDITYSGELTPFLPFLEMAQTVHAGKNTAFGLGKIEID